LSVKLAPRENAITPKTKFEMKSEKLMILDGTRFNNLGPIRIPIKR
jgi:hypothetical protein